MTSPALVNCTEMKKGFRRVLNISSTNLNARSETQIDQIATSVVSNDNLNLTLPIAAARRSTTQQMTILFMFSVYAEITTLL